MADDGFALFGLQIQRLLLARHVGLISVAPSGANALLIADDGFALSGTTVKNTSPRLGGDYFYLRFTLISELFLSTYLFLLYFQC